MFHHKNYLWMSMLCCFVAPTMLCSALGGDAFKAFWIAGVLRYVCVLHGTWLVNSLAHLWGTRPYLGNILPCENLIVSIFAMGEGWHNYHHAYPYDYSANEYGWWQWNPTTAALDLFAAVGLVKDRRRASPKAGNVPDSELPQFSMEDVKASVGQAAMLLVLDGYVYDVSTFVGQGLHPGGEKIIKAYMGKDVSETFAKGSKHQHTPVAYNVLKDYKMGILKVTEEKLKEM
jgi:cytochrome b involved in lipid metabolism